MRKKVVRVRSKAKAKAKPGAKKKASSSLEMEASSGLQSDPGRRSQGEAKHYLQRFFKNRSRQSPTARGIVASAATFLEVQSDEPTFSPVSSHPIASGPYEISAIFERGSVQPHILVSSVDAGRRTDIDIKASRGVCSHILREHDHSEEEKKGSSLLEKNHGSGEKQSQTDSKKSSDSVSEESDHGIGVGKDVGHVVREGANAVDADDDVNFANDITTTDASETIGAGTMGTSDHEDMHATVTTNSNQDPSSSIALELEQHERRTTTSSSDSHNHHEPPRIPLPSQDSTCLSLSTTKESGASIPNSNYRLGFDQLLLRLKSPSAEAKGGHFEIVATRGVRSLLSAESYAPNADLADAVLVTAGKKLGAGAKDGSGNALAKALKGLSDKDRKLWENEQMQLDARNRIRCAVRSWCKAADISGDGLIAELAVGETPFGNNVGQELAEDEFGGGDRVDEVALSSSFSSKSASSSSSSVVEVGMKKSLPGGAEALDEEVVEQGGRTSGTATIAGDQSVVDLDRKISSPVNKNVFFTEEHITTADDEPRRTSRKHKAPLTGGQKMVSLMQSGKGRSLKHKALKAPDPKPAPRPEDAGWGDPDDTQASQSSGTGGDPNLPKIPTAHAAIPPIPRLSQGDYHHFGHLTSLRQEYEALRLSLVSGIKGSGSQMVFHLLQHLFTHPHHNGVSVDEWCLGLYRRIQWRATARDICATVEVPESRVLAAYNSEICACSRRSYYLREDCVNRLELVTRDYYRHESFFLQGQFYKYPFVYYDPLGLEILEPYYEDGGSKGKAVVSDEVLSSSFVNTRSPMILYDELHNGGNTGAGAIAQLFLASHAAGQMDTLWKQFLSADGKLSDAAVSSSAGTGVMQSSDKPKCEASSFCAGDVKPDVAQNNQVSGLLTSFAMNAYGLITAGGSVQAFYMARKPCGQWPLVDAMTNAEKFVGKKAVNSQEAGSFLSCSDSTTFGVTPCQCVDLSASVPFETNQLANKLFEAEGAVHKLLHGGSGLDSSSSSSSSFTQSGGSSSGAHHHRKGHNQGNNADTSPTEVSPQEIEDTLRFQLSYRTMVSGPLGISPVTNEKFGWQPCGFEKHWPKTDLEQHKKNGYTQRQFVLTWRCRNDADDHVGKIEKIKVSSPADIKKVLFLSEENKDKPNAQEKLLLRYPTGGNLMMATSSHLPKDTNPFVHLSYEHDNLGKHGHEHVFTHAMLKLSTMRLKSTAEMFGLPDWWNRGLDQVATAAVEGWEVVATEEVHHQHLSKHHHQHSSSTHYLHELEKAKHSRIDDEEFWQIPTEWLVEMELQKKDKNVYRPYNDKKVSELDCLHMATTQCRSACVALKRWRSEQAWTFLLSIACVEDDDITSKGVSQLEIDGGALVGSPSDGDFADDYGELRNSNWVAPLEEGASSGLGEDTTSTLASANEEASEDLIDNLNGDSQQIDSGHDGEIFSGPTRKDVGDSERSEENPMAKALVIRDGGELEDDKDMINDFKHAKGRKKLMRSERGSEVDKNIENSAALVEINDTTEGDGHAIHRFASWWRQHDVSSWNDSLKRYDTTTLIILAVLIVSSFVGMRRMMAPKPQRHHSDIIHQAVKSGASSSSTDVDGSAISSLGKSDCSGRRSSESVGTTAGSLTTGSAVQESSARSSSSTPVTETSSSAVDKKNYGIFTTDGILSGMVTTVMSKFSKNESSTSSSATYEAPAAPADVFKPVPIVRRHLQDVRDVGLPDLCSIPRMPECSGITSSSGTGTSATTSLNARSRRSDGEPSSSSSSQSIAETTDTAAPMAPILGAPPTLATGTNEGNAGKEERRILRSPKHNTDVHVEVSATTCGLAAPPSNSSVSSGVSQLSVPSLDTSNSLSAGRSSQKPRDPIHQGTLPSLSVPRPMTETGSQQGSYESRRTLRSPRNIDTDLANVELPNSLNPVPQQAVSRVPMPTGPSSTTCSNVNHLRSSTNNSLRSNINVTGVPQLGNNANSLVRPATLQHSHSMAPNINQISSSSIGPQQNTSGSSTLSSGSMNSILQRAANSNTGLHRTNVNVLSSSSSVRTNVEPSTSSSLRNNNTREEDPPVLAEPQPKKKSSRQPQQGGRR